MSKFNPPNRDEYPLVLLVMGSKNEGIWTVLYLDKHPTIGGLMSIFSKLEEQAFECYGVDHGFDLFQTVLKPYIVERDDVVDRMILDDMIDPIITKWRNK